MEIFAYATFALVGSLLLATDYTMFKDYFRGEGNVEFLGKATLAFAVLLTVAYYLSLIIVIF